MIGGENDGSVNGVKYFSCEPNHGIFVKDNEVSERVWCYGFVSFSNINKGILLDQNDGRFV